MSREEIWLVDLEPARGAEANKVRPFQVLVTAGESGLDRDWKAQAEQVRSIDVRRFVRQVGTLAESTMHALNDALRLHLDL